MSKIHDLKTISITNLIQRIELHEKRVKDSKRLANIYFMELWRRADHVMEDPIIRK